jgi:hypothetical protein
MVCSASLKSRKNALETRNINTINTIIILKESENVDYMIV